MVTVLKRRDRSRLLRFETQSNLKISCPFLDRYKRISKKLEQKVGYLLILLIKIRIVYFKIVSNKIHLSYSWTTLVIHFFNISGLK